MKNLKLAFEPTDGVLEIKEPEYPFRVVCDFAESELNPKTDEELEHAKRIVECVNACAGIENPGETIRELVESCEAFMSLYREADMRPEDECWEIAALCRKALEKAKGGAE